MRGWVQGVAFVDAGNVFRGKRDLITGEPIESSRKMTIGYGIGLRLASPFAMFRLDVGIPGSAVSPDRAEGARHGITSELGTSSRHGNTEDHGNTDGSVR